MNQTVQSVTITVTDVVNEFNVINGTPLEDELIGTNAADQINGLDGNDFITGGPGIDQLNGGGGNDVFLVAIGDSPDTFNGGPGTDTIAAVESGVEIVFAGGVFGASNSIEVITNDAPGPAADYTVLTGTSANDVLDVSAETVPYYIDGLGGADTILGGSVDDVLIGGEGRNRLTGNGGADIFVISDLTSRDIIFDFDPASGDVFNMSGVAGFNSFADVQANLTSSFGGGSLITLPSGGYVIIADVDPSSLSADDFVFDPVPSPTIIVSSTEQETAEAHVLGQAGDEFIWSGKQSLDPSNDIAEAGAKPGPIGLEIGSSDGFIWNGESALPKSWLVAEIDDVQPLIERHYLGDSAAPSAGPPSLIKPIEGDMVPFEGLDWDHGRLDAFAEWQTADLDHFIL